MSSKIKIPWIAFLFLTAMFLITSCKDKAKLPSVTTSSVDQITQTGAYSGGHINSDGNAYLHAMGVCWDTSVDPTIDKNKTSDSTVTAVFTSHITGLTPSTMYYVRAYATNSEGTSYGETVSFTTAVVNVPTLNTSRLKAVTLTSAMGGGDILNDGGIAVTARGVCWNTTGSPTVADNHSSDGGGTGQFYSTLEDLTLNTAYHVRAYATNSMGTAYGSEVEFTQMEPILDNDGNAYSVVTIGTQIWFGENLRTSYNDGVDIPDISSGAEWANMSTPAFCWYNNDESQFKVPYGAIYNWYAVNTGKLCPTGWHVPSADDYSALLSILGGEEVAGDKLKEAGTTHWAYPNLGATNESGFSALPGGGRYTVNTEGGVFRDLGYFGYLWLNTASTNIANGISFDMAYNLNSVSRDEYSASDGGSVRCIKDSK